MNPAAVWSTNRRRSEKALVSALTHPHGLLTLPGQFWTNDLSTTTAATRVTSHGRPQTKTQQQPNG